MEVVAKLWQINDRNDSCWTHTIISSWCSSVSLWQHLCTNVSILGRLIRCEVQYSTHSDLSRRLFSCWCQQWCHVHFFLFLIIAHSLSVSCLLSLCISNTLMWRPPARMLTSAHGQAMVGAWTYRGEGSIQEVIVYNKREAFSPGQSWLQKGDVAELHMFRVLLESKPIVSGVIVWTIHQVFKTIANMVGKQLGYVLSAMSL